MPRGGNNKIDLTGQRFERLVVKRLVSGPGERTRWLCICDCGNEHEAATQHLKNGLVPSCGCLKAEKLSARKTTHGLSRTKMFQVWADMHARCGNPNHQAFHNYGARGISVCDRWQDIHAFIEDMASSFNKGTALDRIDNRAGYSKENCRWITHKENCQNTRRNIVFEYNGESKTLAEWAELKKINKSTLYYRVVRLGWSLERSLA